MMGFLRRWRRSWHNKANAKRKEFNLIYGWAALRVPQNQRCPYVYVFKIVTLSNGDSIPIGVTRGRELRKFVHQNVLWKSDLDRCYDTVGQDLIPLWDQIIPSASRLPTHRLEMGVMLKNSDIPRSSFFNEYFCFLPLNGKDSNRAAIKIAGFLSHRLKETGDFNGGALNGGKTYWLIAIMSAWKQLK